MKTIITILAGAFILLSCSKNSDIPPCCAKAGCGEECIAECKKNNCTDENCCANCATEGCKGPACKKANQETGAVQSTSDTPACCAKAGCGEECIAECKKNNCTDENCCANCAAEGCKGAACTKKKEESAKS